MKRLFNGMVIDDAKIITGEDFAKAHDCATYRDWLKRTAAESRLHSMLHNTHALDERVMGPPLIAQVQGGRWVVRCQCGGHEVVSPSDPVAFCFSCCNTDNKGALRPVKFPEAVKEIEAALMMRRAENRHFLKGETVMDLIEQNKHPERFRPTPEGKPGKKGK
jgi:hypothetical protein